MTTSSEQLTLDTPADPAQPDPAQPEPGTPELGAPIMLPIPAGWPQPPAVEAFHGICGEIVHTLEPETEADPVAILTQLLVSFGAAVGRGAWFQVEATRHHGNEYMCLVGDSARGRKGSSWDHVRRHASPTRSPSP